MRNLILVFLTTTLTAWSCFSQEASLKDITADLTSGKILIEKNRDLLLIPVRPANYYWIDSLKNQLVFNDQFLVNYIEIESRLDIMDKDQLLFDSLIMSFFPNLPIGNSETVISKYTDWKNSNASWKSKTVLDYFNIPNSLRKSGIGSKGLRNGLATIMYANHLKQPRHLTIVSNNNISNHPNKIITLVQNDQNKLYYGYPPKPVPLKPVVPPKSQFPWCIVSFFAGGLLTFGAFTFNNFKKKRATSNLSVMESENQELNKIIQEILKKVGSEKRYFQFIGKGDLDIYQNNPTAFLKAFKIAELTPQPIVRDKNIDIKTEKSTSSANRNLDDFKSEVNKLFTLPFDKVKIEFNKILSDNNLTEKEKALNISSFFQGINDSQLKLDFTEQKNREDEFAFLKTKPESKDRHTQQLINLQHLLSWLEDKTSAWSREESNKIYENIITANLLSFYFSLKPDKKNNKESQFSQVREHKDNLNSTLHSPLSNDKFIDIELLLEQMKDFQKISLEHEAIQKVKKEIEKTHNSLSSELENLNGQIITYKNRLESSEDKVEDVLMNLEIARKNHYMIFTRLEDTRLIDSQGQIKIESTGKFIAEVIDLAFSYLNLASYHSKESSRTEKEFAKIDLVKKTNAKDDIQVSKDSLVPIFMQNIIELSRYLKIRSLPDVYFKGFQIHDDILTNEILKIEYLNRYSIKE